MDVRVSDVSFGYRDKTILTDIGFHARSGEIVGILGPNGSGKTTTLKIINRLLKARTGTVLLDEEDYNDLGRKQLAQKMGMVPQMSQINFPFTVLDVVMMGRMPSLESFKSEGEDDVRIVVDAMNRTGVTEFADREILKLSGGERQRVIIARALAQEPQVLLLDEPTNHLDVNHQLDILDMISCLAKERGITVIFVSHDLAMAARFCDRVILLRDSRILAAGMVADVMTPENIGRVFDIEADVVYDPRIGGHRVTVIRSLTSHWKGGEGDER